MTTQGQGHSMTLFSVTQIQHFQTSFPPYGASMGCWDEYLFKCSGSHDQDSFQVHIW